MTSVRCHCGDVATFYQSNKDNLNSNAYFFGCPNWRTPTKCTFFFWANEFQTIRDVQILRHLTFENETDSEQPGKRVSNEDNDKKFDCVICLSNERSHLFIPCNHLCCCSTCAGQIENFCPICRQPFSSIQRIFLV